MDRKRQKLTPGKVIAELEQVKEEPGCSELESEIDKYKEQCTELQSENEKLQSENEKLQSENEKLQSENEKFQSENEKLLSENGKLQSENKRLQKYLQDLESASVNVGEKRPINLCHSGVTGQITKIMNNTYPQTPGMVPPLSIPRDYPYGPTPMLTSNPLFPSGVGFAPNMSVAPYPSTAFTSDKRFNSSSSSSSYLLALNNSYPVFSSQYPASSNNPYPASSSYPASCDSLYPASASPYLVSSTKCYLAPSNNRYPTSSNSPYPAPTSVYPCSSNRHYPATISSYSGPTSMNQPLGASPYLLLGSRGFDSKFGPSVNQSSDGAVGINSLPDEIIEEIFGYLTQNQLGQIARVCRRWNVLTKSPLLWRKVHVKIFSSDTERNAVTKSFINGLPPCVSFIRLDFEELVFSEWEDLISIDFEELCAKLHQKCPHLEELILAYCTITNILPEVINFCTQYLQCVKKLVFYYCRFSNHSRTVELNANSKIEVLELCCCDVKHFNRIQFSKLLYLKELRLSVTNVDDTWFVDNAYFFNQLHVLDVAWTSITASTFLVIQRHGHNLKELYLCKCNLEAHDLNFNKSAFPHLKTICLSDSYVTCEVVVSLIQSCPSLENVYVDEDVAESFAAHPFVVANRCRPGIVKAIGYDHKHNCDYSHN